MTNNSIFTRVLSLVLCVIMFAGVLTSCFQMPEFKPTLGTHNHTTPNAGTTTGDRVDNEPTDDPTNPENPDPVDPNELYSGSTTLANSDLIYGSLANDVFIGGEEGVAAMIPADVKVEAGASSLALSIKKVEDETLADTLSNLDVHISGIALDNTVPMTVMLGAILPAELGLTELKLYHVENGTPVLMTRVNSATDFAIHNQYVYDAETGNVTIYVSSFSVFTAVQTTADVWDGKTTDTSWYNENDTEFRLTTVEQFIGFRDLVDEGNTFEGKTVTLATDIDLAGKLFNPIGGGWAYNGGNTFNGTFDGGNHTIYNLYVNGWELDETGDKHSSTSMGAGLFSSLHNATIKNLAVVGSELIVETTSIGIIAGVAQGKCTFENIVVSSATLGNYQMRNGGIVGDIYVIADDNVPEGEYSHTFTNIVVDSSVKLSSMWGDFDTGNGGVIGGKYGSSKVLMQNVIVAAELDVFSDVTAAYQWYAYRRCGMLVGYTGQNSPKQATNAAAEFLTCVNVNVYYGDWVNYTYYQFANQDSSTGRRYPWVRAQESPYNNAFSNVRYGVPTHTVGDVTTKVSDLSLEELNKVKTGYAEITFNQLYGGGQGVYGTAEHKGVTTNSKEYKTIFVENNGGWTNLKLQYWFANGNDTWTTIIDGIDMSTMLVEGNVYKIQLPNTAYAFKIVADGDNASQEFVLGNLADKVTVTLNGEVVEDCTHTNTTTTTVDATCTVAGSTTVTCDDCHETISVTEIPATGHVNTTTTTVDATCTTNGSITVTCACGHVVSTETISAKGHTAGAEADCDNAQTCTVCGAELHSALGHTTVIDAAVAPTCTTTGLTEGSHCSVCDEVFVAQTVVNALGHKYDNACDTTCNTCGATREVGEHNYETEVTAPTCTTDGYTTYTCTVCGHSYVDNKVSAAHTVVVDKAVPATCTTAGKTEGSHCSVCNTVLVAQKTVAALGHDWKADAYKCSGCGLVAEKKTVYFQNNWNWTDVRVYYWCSDGSYNEPYPGVQMTKDHNDGTYDIYKFDIPAYADSFNINGIKNDGSGKRDETPTIKVSDVSSDYFYYMNYNNGNEVKLSPKVVYLVLDSTGYWKQSSARFAVYFFNNSTGKNAWVSMTWDATKNAYKCNVPDGQWEGMIYCRMNPSSSANNWNNKWNQTGDLTIPNNGNNCGTLKITNSGNWDGSTTVTWSKK